MGTTASNPFDQLPDELVEYIFLLIVHSPPIEPFSYVNIPSSSFYYPHLLHEPYLRRTFKDLISLEIVCRRFYNLLRSPTFWLKKCHQDHVVMINEPLVITQGIDFRRLYFSNPFHPDYNLLKIGVRNQVEEKKIWSPSVSWEATPIGSDLLYDLSGDISSCYATSHTWGEYRRDNIRLLRRGEEKLISINPVIEFTVCVAGRWDCSSICNLELRFSDHHTWRYERSFTNGDRQWYRITYRYMNYRNNQMPTDVSLLVRGKDQHYWAGNYGTKFAQMKLRLALREEDETENQQLEEPLTEPDRSNEE